MLDIANNGVKENQQTLRPSSHDDRFGQLIVNVISAVLDGDSAAALSAGDDRDRLAAVAAQGEQKCIELLIIRFDPLNGILSAVRRCNQMLMYHLL